MTPDQANTLFLVLVGIGFAIVFRELLLAAVSLCLAALFSLVCLMAVGLAYVVLLAARLYGRWR